MPDPEGRLHSWPLGLTVLASSREGHPALGLSGTPRASEHREDTGQGTLSVESQVGSGEMRVLPELMAWQLWSLEGNLWEEVERGGEGLGHLCCWGTSGGGQSWALLVTSQGPCTQGLTSLRWARPAPAASCCPLSACPLLPMPRALCCPQPKWSPGPPVSVPPRACLLSPSRSWSGRSLAHWTLRPHTCTHGPQASRWRGGRQPRGLGVGHPQYRKEHTEGQKIPEGSVQPTHPWSPRLSWILTKRR